MSMDIRARLVKRHPFSGRLELNTRAARERDAWIDTAAMYGRNESFWRNRTKERCSRDGHAWVEADDGNGRYCTCCGALVSA